MTTHFKPIGHSSALCKPYGAMLSRLESVTDDHRKCDCVACIAKMSDGEQVWHENNNPIWQVHLAHDKRRKRVDVRGKQRGGYYG